MARMERISLGQVLGQNAALRVFARTSTSDVGRDDELLWGKNRLVINTGTLPPKLVRAIPNGYYRARGDQWNPFVTLAIAYRLLQP